MKLKNGRPIRRPRLMQASALPCRHPTHCSCRSKTGRWLLVSRFCTFCYERRKASRTKQFGMHTHPIYTGNSGWDGHSVAITYPNYIQYIYSTQTWEPKFCRHSVPTQLVVPTVTDTSARWHWMQDVVCRYDAVWKYCTYVSVGILASSFADEKSPIRSITAHFNLQKLL